MPLGGRQTRARAARQHAPRSSSGRRSAEIDIFRGIAVVGVVLSHTLDGLVNSGLLPHEGPLILANEWLYLCRMPAIAFVLGLFAARGVEKYGVGGYIRRRGVLAVYVYLVWYVIQTTAEVVFSGVKNTPVTIEQALRVWIPPAQLWFLPYLAVSAIVLAVLQPWRRPVAVKLALLGAASLALWGWSPNVIGARGLALIGFSAVGAVVGAQRFGRLLGRYPVAAAVAGVVGGLGSLGLVVLAGGTVMGAADHPGLIAATVWAGERDVARVLVSVAASVLGVAFLAGVSVVLARIPYVSRLGVRIGGSTLPIYVAHILVTAGCRIVLARLGLEAVPVHVLVAVVLGVALPMLAEHLVRRTPLRFVFEPPGPLLGRPRASPLAA